MGQNIFATETFNTKPWVKKHFWHKYLKSVRLVISGLHTLFAFVKLSSYILKISHFVAKELIVVR